MTHRSIHNFKSMAKISPRALFVVLIVIFCVANTGCVRRRLTIRSNPPGAHVFVDDQEIGFTPVSTSFVYYATRTIRLEKDGFETLTVKQNFYPTWYQVPPLDFVTETIYPGELRDERAVDFQMIPTQIVQQQDLLNRAEGLRQSASLGQALPIVPAGAFNPTFSPTPATLPPLSNTIVPPTAQSRASMTTWTR